MAPWGSRRAAGSRDLRSRLGGRGGRLCTRSSGPAWTASASGTAMQACRCPEAITAVGRPGCPQCLGPGSHSGKAGTVWAGGQGGPVLLGARGTPGASGGLPWLKCVRSGRERSSLVHQPTGTVATLRMRLWTWLKLTSRNCACRLQLSSFLWSWAQFEHTGCRTPGKAWRVCGGPALFQVAYPRLTFFCHQVFRRYSTPLSAR